MHRFASVHPAHRGANPDPELPGDELVVSNVHQLDHRVGFAATAGTEGTGLAAAGFVGGGAVGLLIGTGEGAAVGGATESVAAVGTWPAAQAASAKLTALTANCK